jgi:hypothetical protein
VIGAGPYGLSAAAHLRAAGVSTHVLGLPMDFWERCMPAGMLLRSAWEASHIADPSGHLTLARFGAERGRPVPRPVPLADYLAYGRWFQRSAVPDIDGRRVREVAATSGGGFSLRLSGGDSLVVGRVVVATGLEGFASRPSPFAGLPRELASHSLDHADLSVLGDRSVLVVGAGQSALESAALLTEAGARVELMARAPAVRWLRGGRIRRRLGPLRPLLYPSTDVGPPGLNHLMARPLLLGRLPASQRDRAIARSIRPAGAEWLRERLADVTITLGTRAVRAEWESGLEVSLSDGSTRTPDHVLLATGYQVDIARSGLLESGLLEGVERAGGYPSLRAGLESSVPGLHFAGAAAAGTYGPLMRFVSGTRFSSRALAAQLRRGGTRRPLGRAPLRVPRSATPPATAPAETLPAPSTTR